MQESRLFKVSVESDDKELLSTKKLIKVQAKDVSTFKAAVASACSLHTNKFRVTWFEEDFEEYFDLDNINDLSSKVKIKLER